MGIVDRIFGEKKTYSFRGREREGYIDLEKYVEKTTAEKEPKPASMHIRIGEIQRYEDLKDITNYVYGGNLLLLEISPLSDEEVMLKRITNELKKLASDIDGDVAGIGNNLMILAPKGVKIDRRKLRGKYA